jgi:hypothetical protein
MNVLLFVAVLVSSFIVVRIGAIAFQLTGVEWSMAKFQALSCFSGTGFTTRESELIVSSPQRRRIASILIVFGNAGLVTLIATFANSLRPRAGVPGFKIPFLDAEVPSWLVPWIHLLIIAVVVYVMFRVFTRAKFVRWLTNSLRQRLIKRELVERVTFEEMVIATGGYGISRLRISESSPILNKLIMESGLREGDINVLAVVRAGETIANPKAAMKIQMGDELISFGKLENVRAYSG